MTNVSYLRGYNDQFHNYAAGKCSDGNIPVDYAIKKAAASGAKVMRFGMYWDSVQPTGPTDDTFWSGQGHPANENDHSQWPAFYNYDNLKTYAAINKMKLLPVISGAPSWLDTTPGLQRLRCAGKNSNPGYYPAPTAASTAAFADFVIKVIDHFDKPPSVIDAVEIWNEPNLIHNKIYIEDPSHFSALLSAVIARVGQAYTGDNKKTVVSGGLGVNIGTGPNHDPDQGPWKPYLDGYCNQCGSFALGLHSYELTHSLPADFGDRVTAISEGILGRYDDFASYLLSTHGISRDIWVTESGSYSGSPLSELGQQKVFEKLFAAGKGFDIKANCKAALVHRLYPNSIDSLDQLNGTFFKFSTYTGTADSDHNVTWNAKPSVAQLVSGGWPIPGSN